MTEFIVDEQQRIIQPIGRLDAVNVYGFEQALGQFPENNRHLIVDFSACHYLSSAAIRLLILTRKRLLPAGGQLCLSSVSREVRQILEMAGLHHAFRFEATADTALASLGKTDHTGGTVFRFSVDGLAWVLNRPVSPDHPFTIWKGDGMVNQQEFGFGVGLGWLSDADTTDPVPTDLFVSCGHAIAFLPSNQDHPGDFRISANPRETGFRLQEAFSFGHQPAGQLWTAGSDTATIDQLMVAADEINKSGHFPMAASLLVVADQHPVNPSVLVLFPTGYASRLLMNQATLCGLSRLAGPENEQNTPLGIKLSLTRLHLKPGDTLQEILLNHLTFENVTATEPVTGGTRCTNPMTWIFGSMNSSDGFQQQIPLETTNNLPLDTVKSFLARQLYEDSSRLIVEPMHGGFSAQTFRVTSFDHNGRKMRPTVLKIAHRDIITRESDRCKQYALPYIFNNSAIVLGTVNHGNTGALRYNFVGIGGETSQLRWLTHIYQEEETTALAPLFDKIFMQILNPWYGQPVEQPIEPYKDHDPTFTFFPHIYNTIETLFGLSADKPTLACPELGREITNPYWFLKHVYPMRRNTAFSYMTAICHGDLNMQNILVDENRNVYLIDFSETRPRSVVSDFARLEAILMIDNAPVADDAGTTAYVHYLARFYTIDRLDQQPDLDFEGNEAATVRKNAELTMKMRQFALNCNGHDTRVEPYFLALLEWVLPIVCYQAPVYQKRISTIAAGLLCEQLNPNG